MLYAVNFIIHFPKYCSYIISNPHLKYACDISLDIGTGYGLDGKGSIPGRDKMFFYSTASRPALGPTQPPIQWVSRISSTQR
jgi:hypothetical protein